MEKTMHEMAYRISTAHDTFPWKRSLSKADRHSVLASAKALKSEYLYRCSKRESTASRLRFTREDRVKLDHLIRKIGTFDGDSRAILKLLEVYRKNDPKTLTKLLFDYRFPVFPEDQVESNAIRIRLIAGISLVRGEPRSGSPVSGAAR